MNILKKIIWYVIEAIIFIVILSFVLNHYSNKLTINEQNLKAANSELVEVKLKNGQLLVARDSYISTIDNLENILDVTKKEVKELQRDLNSKLAYISQIETNIKVENIEVVKDSIIYVNNNPNDITANFSYNDEWIKLEGYSRFTIGNEINYNTIIKNININVPLNVGITDDYQIFAKSPNPYINFTDINGAVIEKSKFYPKKKRFNWGLQGGFGMMYDFINKNISAGPYVGVGVEYNF